MKSKYIVVIGFLVIVMGMVGCGNMRPTTQTNTTVKDSTWTETRYVKRDTTITIPGDTTFIRIPITEITETPIVRNSGRSSAKIKKVGNDLEITAICEQYVQNIELLETQIKQLQKIVELTEKKTTIPVKYVPWTVKILAWIGAVCLGAGFVFIGFKLLKK